VAEVAVTRLGRGDEAEVARFDEVFDDPFDADATRTFLDDERHHLIVAYVDGRPAGFVSATVILHPDNKPELFLNEIGVVERFQRKGAASALMDELKRLATELGCTTIWVLTDEGNPAAMAMYEKTGGVWDGERHIMFEYDLTK